MKSIENIKLTREERHHLLETVTQGVIPGCTANVIKHGNTYQLHIQYERVEDLLPIPESVEGFERSIHQFLRWAAKWQRRGMRITLETWKTKRPEDGV